MNIDEFIEAVEKIADTSFDASAPIINGITGKPITDPVVRNLLKPEFAKRRSGSTKEGFHRPGERDGDGAPFVVAPPSPLPPCKKTGRDPTDEEKRAAWPLQNEYLNVRLGKDRVENCKLWDTAKWIDKIYRTATLPKEATRPIPLVATGGEDFRPSDIAEGFEIVHDLPFDALRMLEKIEERDAMAKIDVNELLRNAGPRPPRVDSPGPEDRADADKALRTLMAGMRSLWSPVKLAIFDHVEMWRLGTTQGARRDVAPAVGRQRVIEGLRLAAAIRRGMARSAKRDYAPLSVDGRIREVLAGLSAKLLPANDNWPVSDAAKNAA
jgi:hypothetical protein